MYQWKYRKKSAFQEFMRHGGLHSWIQERGQPLEAEYGYLGGIIAVVVTR